MSPDARGILLFLLWTAWWIPFFVLRAKNRGRAVRRDLRARWGIVIQAVAYWAVYLHDPQFWRQSIPLWRVFPGVALALVAILLSWTAVTHLGRQWRVDAGLNADHELVRTGPYRIVRHPIYASMFCMLLMSVMLLGTLPGWPCGVALFIAGTEIRVRTEDGLLRERFGDQFRIWQQAVPAWVPFVR
jgi:protein-S-isoprenylcysteine O-methyltransferase Ste14